MSSIPLAPAPLRGAEVSGARAVDGPPLAGLRAQTCPGCSAPCDAADAVARIRAPAAGAAQGRRDLAPPPHPAHETRAGRPAWEWALRGLFLIVLGAFVREARPLLAPVLIAIVLTFVFSPLVRRLRARGVPEAVGAAIVVGTLVASAVPLATGLAEPAAQWWQRAPDAIDQVAARIDRLRSTVFSRVLPQAPPAPPVEPVSVRRGAAAAKTPASAPQPAADPLKERIASEGVALTGTLIARSATFVLGLAATLILLYFLLACEHWMLARTVEAVPRRRARALLLGGVRAAQREIGHYLAAVGIINAGVGLAIAGIMHALSLPNPILWGVVAALLNFVPYLGPLVMFGLLLLAGMLSFDQTGAMVAPAFAFLALHAVESNLISPWVVGRRLSLSPLAVFLSVLTWGWLWGVVGTLVAVPVLIALHSACRRRRAWRPLARFMEGETRPPPSLRSLLRQRHRPASVGALPRQY